MSCILHIETSTEVCSVALSQDGVCLFDKEDRKGPSHAAILAGFVEEALSFADSHAIPLDAVAVSRGPGSYTGLRIGVSEAKGVAYGRDARLLAIDSLKIITVPTLLHTELPEDALLVPMIDARRMEVYCAVYDRALREVVPIGAQIVDEHSFADSHAIPLDAVAVSRGPGSYPGLRIGVSESQGVAYGRDVRLLAIDSLKIITVPTLLHTELPEDALLVPMIDARRMEVYCAVYDRALREVVPIGAQIVDEHSFAEHLEAHPVYFLGNGAAKCRGVISHPNAHFIEGAVPLASQMIPLAEMALAREAFEDVAYFEPFYLKEFVATKSKKPF